MASLATKLWEDRSGASGIEYGFLAMLVAMALIWTVASAGQALDALFTGVESEISRINP